MSGFFSLAGKVAFVTGGSSGIGAAIVSRFRVAGARVVIADRLAFKGEDLRALDEVTEHIDALGELLEEVGDESP